MEKDYYRILSVDQNAGQKEIKEAYRSLAFQYHPDRNKENPESVEKMKGINEAYAVLSNPAKRREYDELLRRFDASSAYNRFRTSHSEQDIFKGSDIHSVFEEMARAFGLRGYEDIFREFYGPGYRSFEMKRPGFFMKGFIFSGPLGIGRIRKQLGGRRQDAGGLYRYLFRKLSGIELPRSGEDIHDVIHLDAEHARNGGPYAYYLRQKDKRLVVKVPAGIRDGQKIRLSGMGEAGKDRTSSGDLYLTVKIRKPLLEKVKGFVAKLVGGPSSDGRP